MLKAKLLECLRGEAGRIAASLPLEASFNVIYQALVDRYQPGTSQEAALVDLQSAERNCARQTVQEFVTDLKFLVRRAYPRARSPEREAHVKRALVRGHPREYQQILVTLEDRDPVSRVVSIIERYESCGSRRSEKQHVSRLGLSLIHI